MRIEKGEKVEDGRKRAIRKEKRERLFRDMFARWEEIRDGRTRS